MYEIKINKQTRQTASSKKLGAVNKMFRTPMYRTEKIVNEGDLKRQLEQYFENNDSFSYVYRNEYDKTDFVEVDEATKKKFYKNDKPDFDVIIDYILKVSKQLNSDILYLALDKNNT